jgi:hypothetical protein
MGLDVYLERYEDFELARALEKRYEEGSEALWNTVDKKYEDMTQEEKDGISAQAKELAESLGLGEWGTFEQGVEKVKIKSAKFPEHMFEVGYWRSSYNDGGVNNVLRGTIGKDLYYVTFGNDSDSKEYYIQPDWEAAQKRLVEVQGLFDAYIRDYGFRAMQISLSPFVDPGELPHSAEDAVALFNQQADRWKEGAPLRAEHHAAGKMAMGSWYSSRDGHFFFNDEFDEDGGGDLAVVGAIPGIGTLGTPSVYLIYKPTDMDWYQQALEVVGETFAYVLAQPEREKFYLAWSA